MPEYIAKRDTWLSHENREIKGGTKFTTTFPKAPDGKPMRLGENLVLAKNATADDLPADEMPSDGGDQELSDQV